MYSHRIRNRTCYDLKPFLLLSQLFPRLGAGFDLGSDCRSQRYCTLYGDLKRRLSVDGRDLFYCDDRALVDLDAAGSASQSSRLRRAYELKFKTVIHRGRCSFGVCTTALI